MPTVPERAPLGRIRSPALADDVGSTLVALPGVRHVTIGARTADGAVALSAEIDAASADAVIERLAS